MKKSYDFVIAGAGIVGITIASELRLRYPKATIAILEKEKKLGAHSSGRNSGVLHAGFYYGADSLKAKFCKQGNEILTAYCLERGLPINRCGKIVVAKGPEDIAGLEELFRRGALNGVDLQWITESEAKQIEPRVKTYEKALFSKNTSSVEPLTVMKSISDDIIQKGVDILHQTTYISHRENTLSTNRGELEAGYFINAAGLYADKLAHEYGFGLKYKILPFKGLYLYSSEPAHSFKTNIYPVPDLNYPFLGVHFTTTVDGHAKIGPTALPAFWREQYGFKNFHLSEFVDISLRQAKMFFKNDSQFRKLAISELAKYSRRRLVKLAGSLATDVVPENYQKWGKPGIRAQLLNTETQRLEMDFVLEGDKHSFHVLNAVSPGFTCSFPFAKHVCDKIELVIG